MDEIGDALVRNIPDLHDKRMMFYFWFYDLIAST